MDGQILLRDFVEKDFIVKDRKKIQFKYEPPYIVGRKGALGSLAKKSLAKPLDNDIPENLLLLGAPGTGKSLCCNYLGNQLNNQQEVPAEYVHIICRRDNTETKIIRSILTSLGIQIPKSGKSTGSYYNRLAEHLNTHKITLIICLDEIEGVLNNPKEGDNFLFNLIRADEIDVTNGCIKTICIANDPYITEKIRPNILSTIGTENHILFKPYTKKDLTDIIIARVEEVYYPKVIDKKTIEKIAEYSEEEGGDARRAISYLRAAANYCKYNKLKKITIDVIDHIKEDVEKDLTREEIKTYNKQIHMILYAIGSISKNNGAVHWEEAYKVYKDIAKKIGIPANVKRVFFDNMSWLTAKELLKKETKAKGRGRPSQHFRLGRDEDMILDISREVLKL